MLKLHNLKLNRGMIMGNNQREVYYKIGGNAGRKEILWEQGEARVQLALCTGRGTYSGAGLTHRQT